MSNGIWVLWVILGGILIVAEVFTPGFVLLWFGIGALAAAVAAISGISSFALQFLIFSVVSIALTACSSNEFEIKETDVPQNVIATLRAKYPAVQIIKWEAEKENGKFYFEAKIKDGAKEKEVHITADGSSVTEED